MTVRRIRDISKSFAPDIFFLMETKNSEDVVIKAFNGLHFVHSAFVPPHGHGGGGLALFWSQDVSIEVLSTCDNFMDTKISTQGSGFFATFVYGEPDQGKRKAVWELIKKVAEIRSGPWFLSGDFNDIVDNSEKQGGPPRSEWSFVDFRSFLTECDLYDLRHSGNPLSWRGLRHTHVINCRLDRALGNSEWAEMCPNGRCQYLRFEGSDHRPLISHFALDKKKKRGIFRYDRRLKDNEEVKQLIQDTWKDDEESSVQTRIAKCRHALVTWNREKQRNSQQSIELLRDDLEKAMVSPIHNEQCIEKINSSLKAAYAEEEAFWKQRSRQLWLCLGDQNSGYFHAVTRGRRAINKFSVIEDDQGKAFFKEDQIARVISAYYLDLFSSPRIENPNLEHIVGEALNPCISEETNQNLIMIPSAIEIKKAVFAIHPGKAPGPDGFSACFFQSNWEAIGPTIVSEIQDFFVLGVMPTNLNETHIRLIPKVQGAKRVADYRPIALCNVYYKVISKLLAHRLQPILNSIVSENQSAFIPGRAISDNVLITHEVLHFLKVSGAKKHCSMAVKTDMSKAYDRVEWSFIQTVLKRLGFHSAWIGWIMQCISTVSYSFLVNDSPRGRVVPLRGIRQGDPLSPYIFILCSEVLSGLCKRAHVSGQLPGIKVARESPSLNHLLFADDTMFFCKTSESSCKSLMKVLGKYEAVSGQKINSAKSSISFARKTPTAQRDKVKQLLGISKEGGVGKYLGLPEHFGKKKKDLFSSIVDRIRQKAISWSNRFLSGAGKLTLLKSVLSAMPAYAMACFQLPMSLCKRIQSAMTRFWWDPKADKKGMCWVAWEKLTQSKRDGGLGLRDLQCFNTALLGKLGWRILNNPHGLLARILLGKYCNSSSFLEVQCASSASHGWRSVLLGRDLLKQKLGWVVGNGKSINLWNDPWLSLSKPLQPMGPPNVNAKDLLVNELFVPNSVEWDIDKIQTILPSMIPDILALKPSRLGAEDKLVWLGSKDGVYSTKVGYFTAITGSAKHSPFVHTSGTNWISTVWAVPTAPKLKLFLWKALHGALATGQKLAERNIAANTSCCRCGNVESIQHILFQCSYAQQVWKLAPFKQVLPTDSFDIVRMGMENMLGAICLPPIGIGSYPLTPWICWNLWKSRNQLVFMERLWSAEETLLKSILDAKEWHAAQVKLKSSPPPSPYPSFRNGVSPPAHTSVVCRVDGAWSKDLKVAGLGWTSSTPPGTITRHSAICENVSSPLMAECLACRAAVMDAVGSGANHLILESDCLQLVGAINTRSILVETHGIISDIFLCCNQLASFSCRFIPRAANVIADSLAKNCLNLYGLNLL